MFLFYYSEVKFDATFKIRNKLLNKWLKLFAFYCKVCALWFLPPLRFCRNPMGLLCTCAHGSLIKLCNCLNEHKSSSRLCSALNALHFT